jgi:hypothetical protein
MALISVPWAFARVVGQVRVQLGQTGMVYEIGTANLVVTLTGGVGSFAELLFAARRAGGPGEFRRRRGR